MVTLNISLKMISSKRRNLKERITNKKQKNTTFKNKEKKGKQLKKIDIYNLLEKNKISQIKFNLINEIIFLKINSVVKNNIFILIFIIIIIFFRILYQRK